MSGKDRKKKGKGKKRKATESVEEENDEGKETQSVSKQFIYQDTNQTCHYLYSVLINL